MSIEPETAKRFLSLKHQKTGEILRMRRVRGSDGHTVLILEGSLPPGPSAAPPHVHLDSRETIVVRTGLLGIQIGREKFEVPAGQVAVMPPGIVHTWWNAGDELMQLSGRAVPASDTDRYIQALWEVSNASPGRPSIFYLAHILWRHRHTQAVALPPRVIQRIAFPLILLLGTALGKYRGTAWPGSPPSCPGAPETVTRTPQSGVEHSDPVVNAAT